jgi:hypothetical protein
MSPSASDDTAVTGAAAANGAPAELPTPDRIMELGTAFWAAKALLSAVELGVFSELAAHPLELAELRRRLGLHARSARDFFDTLVALGMLTRENGRYANTPATDRFLDRAKPDYIGGMLEYFNARLYPHWGQLTDSLRTGKPQTTGNEGGDIFAKIYSDEEYLGKFLRAMTGLSLRSAKIIADRFPFAQYRTFVDIGCAEGALPVQVALAHSHITGGGFDLPPVRPIFENYVESFSLADRLVFHTGDFHNQELPGADVLALGHILHDWGLETKLMLLEKAHAALPKGGALIVHEAIIDDERRRNAFGLLMSLNMLVEVSGGFDFTGADCRAWMKSVGFRESRVEPLAGPDSMVVAIK